MANKLKFKNNVDITGDLTLGGNPNENKIVFKGTTDDFEAAGGATSVLAERIYEGGEKSELILFKGDELNSGLGPDRIRYRSAEHLFQTISEGERYTTLADTNTRLIITPDGNVGIGTETPTSLFEIIGGGIAIDSDGGGDSGFIDQGAENTGIGLRGSGVYDGVAKCDLYVKGNGNVGVNNEDPTQNFHVIGSSRFESSDGQGSGVLISSAAGSIELIDANLDGSENPFIDFKTSWTEGYDCRIIQIENGLKFSVGGDGNIIGGALTINGTTGNVGVGTIDATEPLDVRGRSIAINSGNTADFGYISQGGLSEGIGLATTDPDVCKLYITPAGAVGVGTQTPLARFNVKDGDIKVEDALGTSFTQIRDVGTIEICKFGSAPLIDFKSEQSRDFDTRIMSTDDYSLRFFVGGDGSTTTPLSLDHTNNVGINEINPTAQLDVNGQVRIRGGVPVDGYVLTCDGDGLATWEEGGGSGGAAQEFSIVKYSNNLPAYFQTSNKTTHTIYNNSGNSFVDLMSPTEMLAFGPNTHKNISASSVITLRMEAPYDGSITIDGEATFEITEQYESVTIFSDGVNYFIQ